MAPLKDLTGQRFGALAVLSRKEGAPRTTWHCRCDCGQEVDVLSTNLLRGLTTSCGCHRHASAVKQANAMPQASAIDVTGQRFGQLTAMYYDKQRSRWLCRCDCGDSCWCSVSDLRSGLRRDCGHVAAAAAAGRIRAGATGLRNGTNVSTIRHVMDGRLRRNNSTGVTGVRIVRNQCMILYAASITVLGKFIYLGRFPTLGEAKEARKEAEKKYFAPLLDDDPPGHEETGGKNHDETR